MNWILRMAWRDSRGSRGRMLVFLSSIVVGVAALVAINGFGANLERTLDAQAQTLLGADLTIESNVPFEPETEALIDSIGGKQSRRVTLSTMAFFPASGMTRLVSLRATEGDFPYYGSLVTVPASAAESYRSGRNALVDATLLEQANASVGDSIRLGNLTYAVAGRLEATPSESAAMMLFSPRVYIGRASLDETLIQRGSRAEYEVLFKLDSDMDPEALRQEIQPHLDAYRLRNDTVEEIKSNWDRALTNLYQFLGLIALTALLLGGVGIGSAIHLYVRRRIESVAVLRCLGARRGTTSAVYVIQALGLGAIGAAAGVVLGLAIQAVVPSVLGAFLPVDVTFGVSWRAVAAGFGAGVGLTLAFALLPLATIADVSPLAALRQAVEATTRSTNLRRLLILSVMAVAVLMASIYQAPNVPTGLAYATGLLLVFLGLGGLGMLMSRLSRRFVPSRAHYFWRQGLANLHRPNNQTTVLMVALGLGSFVVVTMVLLHATLLAQIDVAGARSSANVVMFDVQPEELEGVTELVEQHQMPVLDQVPIIAMRIERINGRSVESIRADSSDAYSWAHRREYRSTYRGELSDTERVISGRFTGRVRPGGDAVPVSVEHDVARELGVTIGDSIVFNVHGLPVQTVVGSLREVDWNRMAANFFVVFPEGVLEEAPQSYVVLSRAGGEAGTATFQRDLVNAFPTVAVVDLDLIVQVFDELYGRAAFVVQFMALFSIITGLIVLAGAVLATRYERSLESILLKALGAARSQVIRIMLVEYAFIGLFAAVAGLLLAIGAGAALAHFIFDATLVVRPLPVLAAVLAVVTLTVTIGMLTSRGTYDQPVLAVLRAED